MKNESFYDIEVMYLLILNPFPLKIEGSSDENFIFIMF